jgi:hypothetical protein
MKRVFLGCDPAGQSVIWEEGGFMSRSGSFPITVSEALRSSLLDWNGRMAAIVRTPEAFDTSELVATRFNLNEEGEQLAQRIMAEHKGHVEVRFLAE